MPIFGFFYYSSRNLSLAPGFPNSAKTTPHLIIASIIVLTQKKSGRSPLNTIPHHRALDCTFFGTADDYVLSLQQQRRGDVVSMAVRAPNVVDVLKSVRT